MTSETQQPSKNRELSTQWRIAIVVALIGVAGTIIGALIASGSAPPVDQVPHVNVGTIDVTRSGNVEAVRVSGDAENLGGFNTIVAMVSALGTNGPPVPTNETSPNGRGQWSAAAHISPLPRSSGVSVQAGVYVGTENGDQATPCPVGPDVHSPSPQEPVFVSTPKGSVELCAVSKRVASR